MSKSYKFKKLLVRRYQILAAILFLLAAGLVLLPKYKKNEGITADLFVKKVTSTERYISTDELADRIINQDPSILLIDIRPENEFQDYTLPNAINIPLEKFLDEDNNSYINQDVYDVILYSNDNFYSDQAWMLGSRMGYSHLFVLKGGLNEWFNTIINPKYPDETMPEKAFVQYDFRKAAGRYFGVGASGSGAKKEIKNKPVKKVLTVKKKKKRTPEGGC